MAAHLRLECSTQRVQSADCSLQASAGCMPHAVCQLVPWMAVWCALCSVALYQVQCVDRLHGTATIHLFGRAEVSIVMFHATWSGFRYVSRRPREYMLQPLGLCRKLFPEHNVLCLIKPNNSYIGQGPQV